jgi:predicted HAD superfamily Cof-like phosphohydrolase
MISNLFTMSVAAEHDPRQQLPEYVRVPPLAVRELRARLILEEAMETIHALGFNLAVAQPGEVQPRRVDFSDMRLMGTGDPNLLEIIDGCVDTQYVTTGTLAACGVRDLPHIRAVNIANDAKFPGGVAIMANGKYQKPEGWTGPDHARLLRGAQPNLRQDGQAVVQSRVAKS